MENGRPLRECQRTQESTSDPGAQHVEKPGLWGQLDDAAAEAEPQRAPVCCAADLLDASYRASFEEPQQAGAVEGFAKAQPQLERARQASAAAGRAPTYLAR
jgi:hypothetical protein